MSQVEITVGDNGPLRVSGENIVIKDMAGRVWDLSGRQKISLCRCGQSANKPFCDGAHKACAFDSRVEAGVLPPPAPKPAA